MTAYSPTKQKEWASSSVLDELPSLPVLQSWVHRPAALAKCTISDVYNMRALAKGSEQGVAVGYSARDVFMLNRFPCRMVELVGWVAGVDDKEKAQTVYLDDGDGQHILPVTIKLSLAAHHPPPAKPTVRQTSSTAHDFQASKCFVPAKERKELRRIAIGQEAAQQKAKPLGPPAKVYVRNDVRVGDMVMVKGRIDEWRRGSDWVRQVAVEPGAGGSISIVDPDHQHLHLEQVMALHDTLYSRRFIVPPLASVTQATQSQSSGVDISASSTFASLASTMPSSEIGSEASVDYDQVKLCKPSKLRPSQLTDRTFKQYLLDYITQETVSHVEALMASGQESVKQALQETFPEYRQLFSGPSTNESTPRKPRMPFTPRHDQVGSCESGSVMDQNLTPRPYRGMLKPESLSTRIQGFNIPSILHVPHLAELADMVVEEQSRKEEKRRRRRIRDGTCTPKDLESQASASQKKDWRLSPSEKRARMERLVKWVIRGLSEEGVLVQIQHPVSSSISKEADLSTGSPYRRNREHEYAYLPLPESLLFPLLIPHIQSEMIIRSKLFLRRTDPRYKSGILLEEVVGRLRRCGEEGRWERVGNWVVEDALVWGEGRGEVKKVGKGYVV